MSDSIDAQRERILVTTKELSRMFSIDRGTIYRLRKSKRIRYWKLKRQYRYDPQNVRDVLLASEEPPPKEELLVDSLTAEPPA
jgi:excisionase family DNA binding protein